MQESIKMSLALIAAQLKDVTLLSGTAAHTTLHLIRRNLSQAIDKYTEFLVADGTCKIEKTQVKNKKTGKVIEKNTVKYLK